MTWTSILLASLFVGDLASDSSKDLEARWRREYPAAVKNWDAVMKNFVVEGRYLMHWYDGSTTNMDALTVAALDERKLYVIKHRQNVSARGVARKEDSSVACRTPEFMFNLKKAESSAHFRLLDYGRNVEDDDAQFIVSYRRFVTGAIQYQGMSLFERMVDPTFVLKLIKHVQRDGEDLIRIEYTCDSRYATDAGYVDLDPSKNWGVRSVNTLSKGKKNGDLDAFTQEVAYREVAPGQFFPHHLESNYHTPGRPEIYQRSVADFDRITLGAATPDIFRLPAYGLPDLPLEAQPQASVFTFRNPLLWLAMAAMVSCFVALWRLRSSRVETT